MRNTAKTMKSKYGDDYFAKIGSMGGKKKVKTKGFGSMSPEKRSAAGRKGGKVSKRTRASDYLED